MASKHGRATTMEVVKIRYKQRNGIVMRRDMGLVKLSCHELNRTEPSWLRTELSALELN